MVTSPQHLRHVNICDISDIKLWLAPLRSVKIDSDGPLNSDDINGSSQPTYATPFGASIVPTSVRPRQLQLQMKTNQGWSWGSGYAQLEASFATQRTGIADIVEQPGSEGRQRISDSERGGDAASEAIANSKAEGRILLCK